MIRKSATAIISAALLLAGFATSSMAKDSTSSGLGQAWPNATDVSATPHWHVYAFQKDGIRYVQVNDLNGGVQGAIATAGGQVLVLPIGSNSQNVKVGTAGATTTSSETVYSDGQVTISATPLSTGATQFTVTATCTGDPVECNSHLAPTTTSTGTTTLGTSATTTATCTGDPVECNSHLAPTTTSTGTTTLGTSATTTVTCTGDPVECNSHLAPTTTSTGTTTLGTSVTTTATCTGDPVECNSHLAPTTTSTGTTTQGTSAATLAAPTCTDDPVECNSHVTTSSP